MNTTYQIVTNSTQFSGYHDTLEVACRIARGTADRRGEPMYVLDESGDEVACFDGGSGRLGYTYDPTEA